MRIISLRTNSLNVIFGIIVSMLFPSLGIAKEALFDEQAHMVLSEWFSIDPSHSIQMKKTVLAADELGPKFSFTFISDDQQTVNGTLAFPRGYESGSARPIKLALMMHAMGTDQSLWFGTDNPIKGGVISDQLRADGYTILALDARYHGARKVQGIGPKDMISKAHSVNRRLYDEMIIGTVRDYRLAMNWMKSNYTVLTAHTAAFGYSMGAQMSLLLASYESDIHYVVSMVPPYVSGPHSPVAPREHVAKIDDAKVLLLAAKQDPYTSESEYQYVYDLITSEHKTAHYFDSGHLLPITYLDEVKKFINQEMIRGSQ